MTNFFFLLLTIGLCEAQEAVISRSPDGSIIEAEQQNVTLHCGLEGGDDEDTITSVVWYFNGDILTQLPDPQCRDVLDEDESSGSGDFAEDISEFLDHELGSGEENENIDLTGLMVDDNFLIDAIREKRETTDSEGSDEDSSGDKLFEEDEASGSGLDSVYLDVVRLLCDVDPTTLTLASVTRQFSGDYSCAIITDKKLTAPSSPVEVTVEYPPERSEVSSELVTLEEGAVFTPVFCDGEGAPLPEVSWWFEGAEVSLENTLDFTEPVTRSQSGEYSCHISNIHGMQELSVNVDIQHKPACSVTHHFENEELILTCEAQANPKTVNFLWEKDNITFEGQNNPQSLESVIRLRKINESIGTYTCHVTNKVGDSECSLDVTEEILAGGVMDLVIIFIVSIIVVMIVVVILAVLCYLCWRRSQQDPDFKADIKKEDSKSQLLKDDQVHADQDFYDNLPFNKLRNPPKHVVDDVSDSLDYADCDYLDIYTNGPLKYREASEKNATLRKKRMEERKAVKSSYL